MSNIDKFKDLIQPNNKLVVKNDKEIDRQHQQKQFFNTIFGDLEINQDNMIRIVEFYKSGIKESYFDNKINLGIHCCQSRLCDRYFTLATVNSKGGKTEDMSCRTVIAFDFDKKDHDLELTPYIISRAFTEMSIRYSAMVDTGNGYHAYIKINPTTDIDKVIEVQKAIAERLRTLKTPLFADMKAMTRTQILRIPGTLNCKDKANIKSVNLVNMNRDSDIPIESYYKRFCKYNDYKAVETSRSDTKEVDNTITPINRTISDTVERLLKTGTKEGNRYNDLVRIVVELRSLNYTVSQIISMLDTWREKSQYDDRFEYRVKNIYDNMIGNYNYNSDKGLDFEYSDDEELIEYNETDTSKLKKNTRKGAKIMTGNDLVIYSLLKLHDRTLTRDQLIKELTYEGVCRFSKQTLTNTLKSLEGNKFITVSLLNDNKTKVYKLTETRSKAELKFNISFSACMECIKKCISTEELRLYTYIRYLHHKAHREKTTKLKGNLVYIDQRAISEDLGITQGRVSQMVEKLLDKKLLTYYYTSTSKKNGYDYNIFRLVY